MATSNPFIPAGALMAERHRRTRNQFKVGVFAVLAAHLMLVMGLLIQGCKQEASNGRADVTNPDQGHRANDTAVAATPTPSVPTPVAPAPPVVAAMPAPATPATTATPPAPVTQPAPTAPVAPLVSESVPASAPPAVQPVAQSETSVYVVKSGDTLTRIATAHGTTVKAIKSANHLKGERILVGQKLKMPAVSTKVASLQG